MANTKINQLPLYTGNTSGSYLVMNNSGETTTYKVTKEKLFNFVGSQNNLAYFNSTTNQITGSFTTHIVNSGNTISLGTTAYDNFAPERLVVANSGTNSYNIATFQTARQESYAQVNIKNFGSGSNSSVDLVLWNDVTTESSSYLDLGINSSNYSSSVFDAVGFEGDGYLFNTYNDLYLGSLATLNNHGHVHIFGGGRHNDPQISVFGDGTIGFNSNVFDSGSITTISSSGFTYEFSGSLKLKNDIKIDGFVETSHVQGTGSLYLQPNISDNRNFEIYNTGVGDIHIKGNTTYSFFGDDSNYLKIDSSLETVTINSNSGTTLNGFVILSEVSGSLNFTDDASAATGGVPLGGLYRNGNFVMIRMT
jgi:hypothetical protein